MNDNLCSVCTCACWYCTEMKMGIVRTHPQAVELKVSHEFSLAGSSASLLRTEAEALVKQR